MTLFKSAAWKPPKPEDIASRRYPLVDIWDERQGRRGLALMEVHFDGEDPFIVWQIFEGVSRITHWRWSARETHWFGHY